MWLKCEDGKIGNHHYMQFQGYEKNCFTCPLKSQCLKKPTQKSARQVNITLGITSERKQGLIENMKQKIDSSLGLHIYSQRLGTVEPMLGNINTNIGIKRFSLRGKQKVNAQWQLISMINNVFKIHRFAWNGA